MQFFIAIVTHIVSIYELFKKSMGVRDKECIVKEDYFLVNIIKSIKNID